MVQSQPGARQQRRIVLRLRTGWARSLGPHFGDYQAGFRFGQLGFDLVEQRGLERFKARTYIGLRQASCMPWTRHVRTGRDLVRRAFDTAQQAGDLT